MKMKENLTELVFVLDKSGSMSGLEKDTIGGFNSMIADQKKQKGDVIISTVLFDDKTEVLHDRMNIGQINKLTDKDYRPGGCTALLDALGNAIKHINKVQKEMPQEERPEKTMFIMDAIGAAANIGIKADRAVRYECGSAGTALKYRVLSKTVGKFRAAKAECAGAALENWQEDIEQDFETRKKA